MSQTQKSTYFLSDLHLGASYLPDEHAAERRVCAFLDSISGDAETIYLVGDILDYWYEYRHVVPRGYVRFFGKLAELADRGVRIVWLIGNHDIWIFDYLPKELGIEVVDGSVTTKIGGKTFFITHGDGVGNNGWKFRVLRWLFRNRLCQWFYAGVHPRWTVPLAHAWSKSNRTAHDRHARDLHRMDGQRTEDRVLLPFAREYLAGHPEIDYFVFGHSHTLSDTPLEGGSRAVVLGDWIEKFSYARFDGEELSLHQFKNI